MQGATPITNPSSRRVMSRERECGKVRYRDKAQALGAARARTRPALPGAIDDKAKYLRTYPCHICNGWHLTSQPSRVAAVAGGEG